MVPDTTGADPVSLPTYGFKSYTFTAANPGTFLYEAAPLPNAEHQAAMGLHGALIVRPARTDTAVVTSESAVVTDAAIMATDLGATVSGPGIPSGTTIVGVTEGVSFTMSAPATAAGTVVTVTLHVAYGDVATAFRDEAVLVLSEIDPALNNRADPATFDMRNFAPRYFLINGKPYPNTDPIASAAGNKLLLRYVNAGAKHHSMGVLGLRQVFVAKDASLLPTLNHNVVAETLAPGQTGDAIVTVPGSAADGSKFAVYDASLNLFNSNAAGLGGMLTFVTATGTTAVPGPAVTALTLTGNPQTSLAATITASTGRTVTNWQYWVDNGAPTTTAITTPSLTVDVTATIPVQPTGNHNLYVRGQDDASPTGTWGAIRTLAFAVDTTGPVTGGLTLAPNPSSGSVTVALGATANDSTTGGSNVIAAEYTIDGGTAVPMTLGGLPAPIRSLTATIPSGLAPGAHTVAVRSQDALGNWGASGTITLNVVTSPPVTSALSVAKTPNNGALPLSATQPVVRVTATMTSTGSTIAGAEGFIDTLPAITVRGFPFVPSDGVWNSATEVGTSDIPLTTIAALANGPHTIYVRGKDAVGNWGAAGTTILTIDKTVPTISSVTLTPSTMAFGTASTALAVTAADIGTGVTGGQYWIDGSATPPATPTAFNGASATINTSSLAAGTHTVYVRVQDAATNWSAVSSAALAVIQAVNDTRTITSNNSATQTSDANAAAGVLANDQPIGLAGRTARIASAPVRTAGSGTGTITVTCPTALGTAATPAIGGNTVCTNGAYRVTLNGVGGTGAARQTSKRGTYQFTYSEILNGVTSNATVTVTVN